MAGKRTAGGRPAKTAEQRIIEGGTPGKGAVSHRPVKKALVLTQRISTDNRPQAPANLPPIGRELWDDVIEALIDINAAQTLDVPMLTMMCMHYALAHAAWEVTLANPFVQGSTGQMRENPAMRVWERNSDAFMRRATEFGLTTLARTKMGLLDVSRRSLESDLNDGLGRNPRRSRAIQVVDA